MSFFATTPSPTSAASPAPRAAESSGMELHIDRLTVEGVSPAEARRLGSALEGRLETLVRERGLPVGLSTVGPTARSLDLPALGLGTLDLPAGATPERIGSRLAETLYAKLNQPVEDPSRRAIGSEPEAEA